MWSDLLNAALQEVEWHEIAQHMIADVDKTEPEPDDDDAHTNLHTERPPMRVIQYESTGEQIRVGKLTDQQADIIDSTPFHLEAFPGDDDRLRVVCDDGSGNIGPWFSRRWNPIGFKRFWPC